MQRVCVYCGSSMGARPVYAEAAETLAEELVSQDLELVYGGASKGIMGVIADRVLELGGKVHGVIPKMLQDKEIAHEGLTELHVVPSMHQRKTVMAALSDAFVAMPGGFGTLEEIIEIVTWGQLQIHDKPCGLLNVDGYFDPLLRYLDHAVDEGFLRIENRRMLLSDDDAARLLTRLERYSAPKIEKWITPDK
ncbi:MAG: TIGR00730 family Rossman fold protein [Woeseiaceae bacterium]|nr:TIGR00730 family Rossman fold protein [Woeseiaceae bacterium]